MSLTQFPKIGYGTWNRPDEAAYDGTIAALEVGYRHLDCAEGYGNEEFVGRAIKDSGVARGDLWVTTKVAPESFGPGQILSHVEASLEKLGVGPVDLLLLHYPSIGDEYEIEDYMAQFAAVYDAGLAKNIGVSNFTKRYIDAAVPLLGDRKIFTNQVEIHPFMQNRPIVDHCAAAGIEMTAFSPMARGAVIEDAGLKAIANEVGATTGQVALAFLMAQGHVVIPSAGARVRIEENLKSLDVVLSDDQVAAIRAMDRGERLVNGAWCPEWDV